MNTDFNITIRKEAPGELDALEAITRDAFWDKYSPGCVEHLLLHRMHGHPAYHPELSFVADCGGELAGGIWYAEGWLVTKENVKIPVLTFGPVAVRPDLQGKGIGSKLIRHSMKLAERSGFAAVLIFGNPVYYKRFGFHAAAECGITTGDGSFCDALLIRVFKDVPAAAFCEGELYQIAPDDARKFDQKFPHRQRHVNSKQLFFVPPGPMPEDPILAESQNVRNQAGEFLRESGILEAWESMGAKVRLVGSFRTGIMCKHDVNLHVYTKTLDASETLRALAPLFAGKRTMKLTYVNGAESGEFCLEWHLTMKDKRGIEWTVDMIQILAGSVYDGVFEDVAEALLDRLTPETRRIIVSLKKQNPAKRLVSGITYCKAVLEDGVRTPEAFLKWLDASTPEELMHWRP